MSLATGTLVLIGIFTLCGLFSILAGWDWFFTSVNSRMLTGRMSRKWARIFYIVLGLAILSMATYLYMTLPAK
jgi:uncharacterized membrane protein YuzA (DUF378 family)